MKKTLTYRKRNHSFYLKKVLLIMKLTTLMLILSLTQIYAAVFSQNDRFDLQLENVTLKQLFSSVEQETSFKFVYRDSDIANTMVSINVKGVGIDEFMTQVLASTGITYRMLENNLIVILPEDMQNRMVTGKVADASTGEPIPGVNIVVEGTTTGTITALNGEYMINVPGSDAVLVFSFVGYITQKITVGEQLVIDVNLAVDFAKLEEVVVTALGLEKSKRTLTYATQQLDMDNLTTLKEVNLGNALAGKVAGVSITTSTGASGVSGDPRIIIRGDRSINNNNQPLIVVDGIPYSSSGGGLSSINSDDVESINVLKGPAASALYGSSANNGVIVVTTKKGKVGQPKLEVNSVTTFDLPYLYPDLQNEYAHGLDGIYMPNTMNYSWGPKMTGQTITDWTGKQAKLEPQPNNVRDVFNTGYNLMNSLSYSTGLEKSTVYFSYSNTSAQGVTITNKMQRHNFNLRLTSELIKKLNMDFRMTYFNQFLEDDVEVTDVGVGQFSPTFQAYRMPRDIRTADITDYYYYNETLNLKQRVWTDHQDVNNPYWSMYANEKPSTSNMVNTFTSLKYDFTDWLYLQVRGSMNIASSDSEEKTWWDTKYIWSGKGNYTTGFSKGKNFTGDALLVFNKELTNDLKLGVNVGAEIKDTYGRSLSVKAGGLTKENRFAMNYAANPAITDSEHRIQKQAVYGMAQLAFKNYLYLDATARNDWSSTLPPPYDYFYPSIGLTGIVSDMIDLPELISFLKIRGSYAEVGNDAGFAQIFQTFNSRSSGPLGFLEPTSSKVPVNLIPEKTKSWEAGAEVRILENRLGVDITWYKSNTYNQLVSITAPPVSGYSSALINCGNIQNTGLELIISSKLIRTNDLHWNLDLNFSRNWNEVIELTESLDKYQLGYGTFALGVPWVEVGKPFGELYTKGFLRNDAGKIIVDATGMPKVQNDYLTYIGNFNYDWRSAIINRISYKNWNISFLIDLNYGGVRTSGTEGNMLRAGTSTATLEGRDGDLIIDGVKEDGTPNDVQITAQSYAFLIGGRADSGLGEPFYHDATNSRLRELSIGYSLPVKSNIVKGLQIAFIGRNLFYIYNGCKWFDPDNTYNTGVNGQGAENAFLPGTRTLGFNIKLIL